MKKLIFLISILVVCSCATDERERIIPEPPLIIVDYEPYTFDITEKGVRYKTIDKNGYVFYFSEYVPFRSYPRYKLGDTLR